jgi:hypothetical protein
LEASKTVMRPQRYGKKPQVPRLLCAPVGMTTLLQKKICHPDRSVPGFPVTRHSPTATYAAFSEESRLRIANATKFDRKSVVAEWKDLRFL